MLEFKTYRTWAIASGYRDNSLKKADILSFNKSRLLLVIKNNI